MTAAEGFVGPIDSAAWTHLQPAPATPVGPPEQWVDHVHDACGGGW